KPTRVQMHTRAFLVLSHAEIETFLEDSAKSIVKACQTIWDRRKRVSAPLAFLISSVGKDVGRPTPLSSGTAKASRERFEDMMTSLVTDFYKRIKDNHGNKEMNVLALFDPLGVPATAYGTTLLPNLDSLGEIRGVHAHTSGKSVASVLDPETEYMR